MTRRLCFGRVGERERPRVDSTRDRIGQEGRRGSEEARSEQKRKGWGGYGSKTVVDVGMRRGGGGGGMKKERGGEEGRSRGQ